MKRSTKRSILQLFFPNRCPVCGEVIYANDDFCGDCRGKLNEFDENFSIERAESFTAVYVYDEATTPAIVLMKDGILGNSAYAFGKNLGEKLKENGIDENIDFIVPVPMYKDNLRKRGYNQAEYIGREIGDVINRTVKTGIIVKSKNTADQKTLSRYERRTNLKGVFKVTDAEEVKGKRLLVVDDVCTTGSTLAEITMELLKAGAKEVHCAACCKTLSKSREE